MNQITPVININCREGSLPDRSGKSPRADPHHDEWVAVPSGTKEGLAREWSWDPLLPIGKATELISLCTYENPSRY